MRRHTRTHRRAENIVFDKTGTLTAGQPTIVSITPASNLSENELLQWAASIEAKSEHPIAKAIVREARARETSSCSRFKPSMRLPAKE